MRGVGGGGGKDGVWVGHTGEKQKVHMPMRTYLCLCLQIRPPIDESLDDFEMTQRRSEMDWCLLALFIARPSDTERARGYYLHRKREQDSPKA